MAAPMTPAPTITILFILGLGKGLDFLFDNFSPVADVQALNALLESRGICFIDATFDA
jgi:hypothetical protein